MPKIKVYFSIGKRCLRIKQSTDRLLTKSTHYLISHFSLFSDRLNKNPLILESELLFSTYSDFMVVSGNVNFYHDYKYMIYQWVHKAFQINLRFRYRQPRIKLVKGCQFRLENWGHEHYAPLPLCLYGRMLGLSVGNKHLCASCVEYYN